MEPELILSILGGLLFFYITKVIVRLPGKQLHSKFVKVGSFANLTLDDFIQRVGPYQGITYLDDGGKAIVWQATGYNITLVFDPSGKFYQKASEYIAN